MLTDITKYIATCAHCSAMNPKFISNPSLHLIEKGDRPMAILHVDLTGDLSTKLTPRKNRYLFILVDSFSKWVEIYPIPNSKSATIANCMWDFVKRFGTPTQVITDKGIEFKGEF